MISHHKAQKEELPVTETIYTHSHVLNPMTAFTQARGTTG